MFCVRTVCVCSECGSASEGLFILINLSVKSPMGLVAATLDNTRG